MSFADFLFANPFIPAAFFVAGLLAMFKMQWQGLYYVLVVCFGVETFLQFSFISFLLVVQIFLSRMYVAASDGR